MKALLIAASAAVLLMIPLSASEASIPAQFVRGLLGNVAPKAIHQASIVSPIVRDGLQGERVNSGEKSYTWPDELGVSKTKIHRCLKKFLEGSAEGAVTFSIYLSSDSLSDSSIFSSKSTWKPFLKAACGLDPLLDLPWLNSIMSEWPFRAVITEPGSTLNVLRRVPRQKLPQHAVKFLPSSNEQHASAKLLPELLSHNELAEPRLSGEGQVSDTIALEAEVPATRVQTGDRRWSNQKATLEVLARVRT